MEEKKGSEMSWTSSRIAERLKIEDERKRVSEAFKGVWDSLWNEIVSHVREYRQQYGELSVITSGDYEERRISIPNQIIGGVVQNFKRHVVLKQGQNKTSIKAESSTHADSLKFDLKVCSSGLVCLVLDEKELSLEQAAILILDPIEFPDLPRTEVS
jgi:hypothetical protein